MRTQELRIQKLLGIVLIVVCEFVSFACGFMYVAMIQDALYKDVFSVYSALVIVFFITGIIYLIRNDQRLNAFSYLILSLFVFLGAVLIEQLDTYDSVWLILLMFVITITAIISVIFFAARLYVEKNKKIPILRDSNNECPACIRWIRFIVGILFIILGEFSVMLLGLFFKFYENNNEFRLPICLGIIMSTAFCVAGIVLIVFKRIKKYDKFLDLNIVVTVFNVAVLDYGTRTLKPLSYAVFVGTILFLIESITEIAMIIHTRIGDKAE